MKTVNLRKGPQFPWISTFFIVGDKALATDGVVRQ